jgi:hypothetical protein
MRFQAQAGAAPLSSRAGQVEAVAQKKIYIDEPFRGSIARFDHGKGRGD